MIVLMTKMVDYLSFLAGTTLLIIMLPTRFVDPEHHEGKSNYSTEVS